jgi:hypothetical protein
LCQKEKEAHKLHLTMCIFCKEYKRGFDCPKRHHLPDLCDRKIPYNITTVVTKKHRFSNDEYKVTYDEYWAVIAALDNKDINKGTFDSN